PLLQAPDRGHAGDDGQAEQRGLQPPPAGDPEQPRRRGDGAGRAQAPRRAGARGHRRADRGAGRQARGALAPMSEATRVGDPGTAVAELTWAAALDAAVAHVGPDKVSFFFEGPEWRSELSYGDWLALSDRAAAALMALG